MDSANPEARKRRDDISRFVSSSLCLSFETASEIGWELAMVGRRAVETLTELQAGYWETTQGLLH